jgi:Domain of unknown function (DUF5753)
MAWFVVDQLSLYRQVGSPDVMEGQMRQLAEVAAMPNVTVQVLPAVAHPANASELIVTDERGLHREPERRLRLHRRGNRFQAAAAIP